MNQNKYDESFDVNSKNESEKSRLKLAFEKAHDIRKFEIELYWKRTSYFWALIAAIFAGYFLMATKAGNAENKDVYLTLIGCIGFIFSLAWFFVMKGSKFWQENWESHLDLLEQNITGPLYKTVLKDTQEETSNKADTEDKSGKLKEYETKLMKYITSPEPYSVSKINQFIAVFTIISWAILIIMPFHFQLIQIIIMALTLYCARVFIKYGKSGMTSGKERKLETIDRASRISDL